LFDDFVQLFEPGGPHLAVAFDPGITTGYAVGIMQGGEMLVRSGQEKWRHIDLYNQLMLSKPNFVIWERFLFRKHLQHEGVELYPRELIGIIHLYLQQQPVNEVVGFQQNPMKSQGSFHSNLKLKEDGVYVQAQPHGMDALRHLLYWYTFGPGYRYNTKGYRKA
jgi:hypothetical protein